MRALALSDVYIHKFIYSSDVRENLPSHLFLFSFIFFNFQFFFFFFLFFTFFFLFLFLFRVMECRTFSCYCTTRAQDRCRPFVKALSIVFHLLSKSRKILLYRLKNFIVGSILSRFSMVSFFYSTFFFIHFFFLFEE